MSSRKICMEREVRVTSVSNRVQKWKDITQRKRKKAESRQRKDKSRRRRLHTFPPALTSSPPPSPPPPSSLSSSSTLLSPYPRETSSTRPFPLDYLLPRPDPPPQQLFCDPRELMPLPKLHHRLRNSFSVDLRPEERVAALATSLLRHRVVNLLAVDLPPADEIPQHHELRGVRRAADVAEGVRGG